MELTESHRTALWDVLNWRRDVRHFRTDPIPERIKKTLQAAMDLAPSVGNARPWRVVEVVTPALREQIIANFEGANEAAGEIYDDDRKQAYNALKLAGLREAPLHLAVFTDHAPKAGHGLGRQTMPEMLNYSTVAAIHTLWLVARAENIGVGWVSIFDPQSVCRTLGVSETWSLTAYLCIGYPVEVNQTPELHRRGWQTSADSAWIKA
ncbi:5,6-dimethylbenzimidazole synthase [Yoonia sp. 2307UL14-13]|uniref:5,6-dimethylbenzimidazole synthase n=1 Tax=Yoonia sp. 2307UL14-13 TaxID=3126506 RepID=UPI0030B7921C